MCRNHTRLEGITLNKPLYQREGAYIPRIAAIHDLCGYGKCSLGVAIPVLSAAGCDVCPVPTGLFSSHTAFPGWYMHDTTEIMEDYLNAWKGIGVDIDAVYSGFLGAPEQVDRIRDVYETYPNAIRVVDPVMADHGKVYPTYTPELCQAMSDLAASADILTPNLTEAAIILGIEWPGADISEDTVHSMIDGLLEKGAKNVVLKGIDHGDGKIHNYVQGESVDFTVTENELLPYMLHGTGDLFASSLMAAVMAGRDVAEATRFASDFVVRAMKVTSHQPDFQNRGVSFEPLLGEIANLLQ
ncbi:MAG: pyridoxamine kinase [Eggerthellaceae bacterium]|nr:pyridoxamine kinase [Eggerthellaceae bacterium]